LQVKFIRSDGRTPETAKALKSRIGYRKVTATVTLL
jgi:hypothetical protein